MSGRALTLHRVSTQDQHADGARAELRRACRNRGLPVVREIEETWSGADANRPGLVEVLRLARKRTYTHLVVWRIDRLFRTGAIDGLQTVQELRRCGVTIVVVGQGLELRPEREPQTELLLTLWVGFAEYERELIRERTRAGLRRAVANGAQLGRPRSAKRPAAADVRKLRRKKKSWAEVAELLDCNVMAARRAVGG